MYSLKLPNEPSHQNILIEEENLSDNPTTYVDNQTNEDCLSVTFKTPILNLKEENKVEMNEKKLKFFKPEIIRIAKLTSLVIYSLFAMSTIMFLFHSFQIKNNKEF
jgi:hypothetical protein